MRRLIPSAFSPSSRSSSNQNDGALAGAASPTTMKASSSGSGGWRTTLAWSGAVLAIYAAMELLILPRVLTIDDAARTILLSQVPIYFYQYSEAAFFTAAMLSILAFIFEDTQEKQQLALLAVIIKGLSWHCDYLTVRGQAVVTFDAYHALLIPIRFVQWACTTTTMLFTLSKISSFTNRQVALVVLSTLLIFLGGYSASMYPPGPASYLALAVAVSSFYFVLYSLYLMIRSALAEANTRHSKISLYFTLWSSLVIWHLFPVAWCVSRLGPGVAYITEPMTLIANFAAKVVFSSCILYNNYVTLQQRRIIAQLEQEHRDRIRLVEELKTAVQSKDDFISVIGHELRTPINGIIQLSSAMASNFGASGTWNKHLVWLETISRSAKHLMGIINDIITFKAARTGMHMKQELVQIGHVVDHVIRTLSPMAKRGVAVEKAVMENLPPIVADERRIIQLLSNLLSNALKFTDKGRVTVSVKADRGARNIIIKVQDTGCGIPKQDLKKLIVPFKQVDMSSTRKYGGTGLGLSIANELVQAHSGTLELDSEAGKGTTAVVTLPVLQPETYAQLEGPFKAAYVKAGYTFEELMSNEVAKAENRRVAAFRSPSMQAPRALSSKASPRSSFDSSAPSMLVEQFFWDGYDDGDTLGPAATESAAANPEGPPPLTLALVSSLYSPTVPQETTHPAPTFLRTLDDSGGPPSPTHLWEQAPAVLHQCPSGSRQAMPPATAPGGAGREPAAGPGAPGAAPAAGAAAAAQEGGDVARREDPAVAPLSSGLPPLDERGVEPEIFPGGYAGSWHCAPRFGDSHDASSKEYYSYGNRMSYEYRPSEDVGPGSCGRGQGSGSGSVEGHTGGQGVRRAARQLTAAFRRMSMTLLSASSPRRLSSVEAPRRLSGVECGHGAGDPEQHS